MPTYELPISKELAGQSINLNGFPQLEIIYLRGSARICPRMAQCFLADEVSITFLVDGEVATVFSHQRDPTTTETGFLLRGHEYQTKNGQIYLTFSVY